MRLDWFDNKIFDRGRPAWVEALWVLLQALLVSSSMPGSAHRILLLRLFGGTVGRGVVIKPRIRVKFPWRLKIGDHVWIGEDAWIDNLAPVTVGDHVCLSQGMYLCTGSHDWQSDTFDLITRPIVIQDHAWICAKAVVGPGVTVSEGAVLTLGSIATANLEPWRVHQGLPARPVGRRALSDRLPPGRDPDSRTLFEESNHRDAL